MKRIFSPSQVNTYLKCGKQWAFRYIDGIKTPPRAAMALGRGVDVGVNHNMLHKIENENRAANLNDSLDAFSAEYEDAAQEVEWKEGEDKGKEKDTGIALTKLHYEEIAPIIHPESVQEQFLIETDAGYDVRGILDIVEVNGTIRDTKTSKTKKQDGELFKNLQGVTYDWAYKVLRGKESKGFEVLVSLIVPLASTISKIPLTS